MHIIARTAYRLCSTHDCMHTSAMPIILATPPRHAYMRARYAIVLAPWRQRLIFSNEIAHRRVHFILFFADGSLKLSPSKIKCYTIYCDAWTSSTVAINLTVIIKTLIQRNTNSNLNNCILSFQENLQFCDA